MRHDPLLEPDGSDRAAARPPAPQEYAAKAKRGLKQMIARQAVVHVFTFAGGIVLARTLTPEIFGIFAIATFFVAAISMLGDLGIAPALVQRKEDLTERDLQVAFTLQQAVLAVVAAIVWLAAPTFLRLYPDVGGEEVVWLIRVIAVLIFLQPWRSISILQMERHLNFSRVAVIEVVEALTYQAIAVTLALLDHGVWALVWATAVRAVLGAALAYACRPWPVRLAWHWPTARTILRYGVPFQAGNILNQMGGWVTPLLVGPMIGAYAVGFVNWADGVGRKPLKLMQSVSRVSFPHMSRLQDAPQELRRTYERYLYPPVLLAGLWTAVMVTSAADLVPLIYTEKWSPAVTALQIFACSSVPAIISWTTGTLLRGTGKIHYSTAVIGASVAFQTTTAIVLVPWLGFIAVPIAILAAAVARSSAFLIRAPKEIAPIAVTAGLKMLICILLAVIIGNLVADSIGALYEKIVATVIASSCVFSVAAAALAPNWLRRRVLEWVAVLKIAPRLAGWRSER